MQFRGRLLLLLACLTLWTGCDSTKDPEVLIEDLVPGFGPLAERGDSLTVHYVGWLEDGTQFDSSRERDEPYSFWLGMGRVIEGWDKGIPGMREGGKRRLTIPPELAYGSRGRCGPEGENCQSDVYCGPEGENCLIPADATLVFEVELLDVQKPEE